MDISSKGPTRSNEDNIHQEKVMHVLYATADCLHNKLSELILLIESFKHKPNSIAMTEFKDKCSKETERIFPEETCYMSIVILSHQKFPLTHYLKNLLLLKSKVLMVYI